MSLLNAKRVILAKIEGTYGTDPTPTGGSNAILIRNLNAQPFNAELASRDNVRPYLGNSDTLVAQKWSSIDFEIELGGAGAAGSAPAWGPLLKACGFAQTLNTASIAITRSSTTATVTETAHGRAVGDVVAVSGATQTEYNGNQTILTTPTADTWTYSVAGSPATPATGTPVAGVSASYAPLSATFPSVTLYYYNDTVLHKITGARGTFDIALNVKQIPVIKFNFTGIYNDPSDTSLPSCDFTSFQIPRVANTTNTPSFSLHSYSGLLESMALSLGGDVQYRTLVGSESVLFLGRKPSGTFVIEAPTVAAKDYFSIAKAGTTGTMALTHGLVGGNIVTLAAPRVSLGNPSYQDSQGVSMLSIPFNAAPGTSGNDELVITVK